MLKYYTTYPKQLFGPYDLVTVLKPEEQGDALEGGIINTLGLSPVMEG